MGTFGLARAADAAARAFDGVLLPPCLTSAAVGLAAGRLRAASEMVGLEPEGRVSQVLIRYCASVIIRARGSRSSGEERVA